MSDWKVKPSAYLERDCGCKMVPISMADGTPLDQAHLEEHGNMVNFNLQPCETHKTAPPA